MSITEILTIAAIIVAVLGVTAIFFRGILIGMIAGRGGSGGTGGDGTGPNLGPSGGHDGHTSADPHTHDGNTNSPSSGESDD